ncbi:hypothetical protein PST407_03249 [Pseudomonas syringae pv. tomato]|nr:hypothetical protein PST407_03249 [Pseudomonas syringae pv. tomato]KUR47128.1 hypothetical protein PSTA9_01855 [Pseudomonas syringae pv. tomato]
MLGQRKAGLQGRHSLLDARVERTLIVDTNVFVRLHHVGGADLLHPVFQVVGRLIRAAGCFHLHLQHRAELAHRIHAGHTELAHARKQLRKPLRHVAGFKTTRLALHGDSLKGFFHHFWVGDFGVLLQRLNHVGRIGAAGSLPNRELRSHRRVGQRLIQAHARTDQLVDQVSHVIARHARVLRSLDHRGGQFRFLRLVGHTGLDRDVPDDRLIVGTDLGRYGQCADTRDGGADARLEPGLALLDLFVSLDLEVHASGDTVKGLIFLPELTDLNTLFTQRVEIILKLAQ